jgi:hypothetical protein
MEYAPSSGEELDTFETVHLILDSARSLAINAPERPGVTFRGIYEENAATPESLPVNSEVDLLSGFQEIVQDRDISPIDLHPYWDMELSYDKGAFFAAAIQSFDLHDGPVPQAVIPPQADVAKFIEQVQEQPDRVRLHQQLGIALDICNDNLLGAVNICWIATRFMARGAEQRVFPDIPIDASIMRDWNNQIAQFETFDGSKENDAPGDTYYFWTQAFAAMLYTTKKPGDVLARAAFQHGLKVMAYVRKSAKGDNPMLSPHEPASTLGRETGKALALGVDFTSA